jgi:hypothetical protein
MRDGQVLIARNPHLAPLRQSAALRNDHLSRKTFHLLQLRTALQE